MIYQLVDGVYRIPDFDKAKEECQSFIEVTKPVNEEIIAEVKKARTEIRKALKNVSDLRIQASKAMLSVFQGQCKELEAMLSAEDERLKAIVDKDKPPEPEKVIITVEMENNESVSIIIDFLTKLGLEPKTKKKEKK